LRDFASRFWAALRSSTDDARATVAATAERRPTGTGDTGAAADSAPVLLPHPPALVGHWYHGDARTKYGDSLTMVLNADGTATAEERRYTLDRTGWHIARTEREGRWEIRYGRTERLCAIWERPTKMESCEPVALLTDTVSDLPLLRYAGRHWRPRQPEPPKPERRRRRG
jgi:hypothetical protein